MGLKSMPNLSDPNEFEEMNGNQYPKVCIQCQRAYGIVTDFDGNGRPGGIIEGFCSSGCQDLAKAIEKYDADHQPFRIDIRQKDRIAFQNSMRPLQEYAKKNSLPLLEALMWLEGALAYNGSDHPFGWSGTTAAFPDGYDPLNPTATNQTELKPTYKPVMRSG